MGCVGKLLALVGLVTIVAAIFIYRSATGNSENSGNTDQTQHAAPAIASTNPPASQPEHAGTPVPSDQIVTRHPTPASNDPSSLSEVAIRIQKSREDLLRAKNTVIADLMTTSPAYQSLKTEADQLYQQLLIDRKTGAPVRQRLDEGAKMNGARAKMQKIEKAAWERDSSVIALQKELDRLVSMQADFLRRERQAAEIAKNLANEREQRRQEAYQPIGAIAVGQTGLLPPYRIIQVIDDRNAIISVEGHWQVSVILSGFGTGNDADGQLKELQYPVKITHTKSYESFLGRTTALVAEPFEE